MRIGASLAAIMMSAGAPVIAQPAPDNPQLIAQAVDRCMATYAVRMTETAAADEAIFAQATRGCRPIMDRLTTAINAAVPPTQAAPILTRLEASAKPNFMKLLARIRGDRARATAAEPAAP